MNKREIITSAVMCVVTILVMVGFTVAWYTRNNISTVTNMQFLVAESGDIIIALESGGEDISVLAASNIYADMGMAELTMGSTQSEESGDREDTSESEGNNDSNENTASGNLEELAPGVYGQVTFYITPKREDIKNCSIVPTLVIGVADGEDDTTWYGGDTEDETDEEDSSENGADDSEITLEQLYKIATGHIVFYADETMTQEIDTDNPLEITWNSGETEKEVVIYWKWHYEYPFSDEEITNLSNDKKEEKIREYDDEDMLLGNNISSMKFYFTFTVE